MDTVSCMLFIFYPFQYQREKDPETSCEHLSLPCIAPALRFALKKGACMTGHA